MYARYWKSPIEKSLRYWKINQASWFSQRGNIEPHKTESGFNNQVVVANVLNMYVKDVNKQ